MLTLHTTYMHHHATARSMAELRPLVEMAFQLLDHLCADKFKLGAQVCTSMTDPHTRQPSEPYNVQRNFINKPQRNQNQGRGRVARGAAGDRGPGGAFPGDAAQGGGGAAAAGAEARGVRGVSGFCWMNGC